MLAIRQFQEERQQWEAQEQALQERIRELELKAEGCSPAWEIDQTHKVSSDWRVPASEDGSADTSSATKSWPVEALGLQEENTKLREELSQERNKVAELRRATQMRKAAWQEELDKISEELATKQRLEEEIAQLRLAQTRFREELGHAAEREVSARREVDRLRRDLDEARLGLPAKTEDKEGFGKVEEMEIISNTIGVQLVAVERELTRQVQQSSQLYERFLHHVYGPMASLRNTTKRMAASGEAGEAAWLARPPPLLDPKSHDLKDNLVKIVNLLRFIADVMEARECQQEREASLYARLEEGIEGSKDYAKSWFKALAV